jgi:DNA phosphorothioation-dependent restriction protein DptH
MTVVDLITGELSKRIAAAEPGHCIRVDGPTAEEAEALRDDIVSSLQRERKNSLVDVRVLDVAPGPGRATVEEAVGIRNNKNAVFLLLVPPALANQASSLDNAFLRVPYAELLESVARHLELALAGKRPDFPAARLRQMTLGRVPIENWLEFLVTLHDNPHEPAGAHLAQVGLLPDEGSEQEIADRLRENAEFIKAVVDPTRAAQGIRERLRARGLRPGQQFEDVVKAAEANPAAQNDARQWARVLHQAIDTPFHAIVFAEHEASSDLERLQVLPFVNDAGTVAKSIGLVLTEDGTLECQVIDGTEAHILVKWRTTPAKTTKVGQWLIEVLPPPDLRGDIEAPSLSRLTVTGARRQAKVKIDITVDDLSSGSLFVICVTPLDDDAQPLPLGEDSQSESQAFEFVFLDEPVVDSPRSAQAASIAEARLRAVVNGAQAIDEGHATWYREQQQFGVTFGGTRASRIPVCEVAIQLQRQALSDPTITGFSAASPYGAAVLLEDFESHREAIPPALARKRAEVFSLLASGGLRDVPELFAWSPESRSQVADYIATYRRALDAATDEFRATLQAIDAVHVTVGTGDSRHHATVLLPLHPLRLAWLASFDELSTTWAIELLDRTSKPLERRQQVSLDDLARLAPTNVPFTVSPQGSALHVYFDELTFGVGLYFPLGQGLPEVLAAEISSIFGVERRSALLAADAIIVADRLVDYAKAHPGPRAMRIAALNPADGVVLASALDRFIGRTEEGRNLRLEVIAYGEVDRYANPLRALTQLQERVDNNHLNGRQNPLFPQLGAAVRPRDRLSGDVEPIHVAVVDGVGDLVLSTAPTSAVARYASMADLLTPLVDTSLEEASGAGWLVSPVLTPRGSGTLASAMIDAHRSHQVVVGSVLGLDGPPALRVEVPLNTIDEIRVLHQRSDWVLTLDRYIGLDFFETSRWDPTARKYILDHTPDFIAGMGHKLTVTTAHRVEVTGVLKRAMEEFGLDALDGSATQILNDLMSVSGRLVLRLQSSEGFARESVSLAALVAHLRLRGELDDAIIVPVDSHQEIFGRFAPGNETGRRCDMLIVRLTKRKLSIQCVEVKSRKHAALPLGLADDIVDQLMNTKALLEERFFASDPPRVDAPLQRARLAGLLHYYADRAVTGNLLNASKVADMHRNIDRIVEGGLDPEISLRGFVISLTGAEGIPASHRGVPISVLTANDLGEAGLTLRPDSITSQVSENLSDGGSFIPRDSLAAAPTSTTTPEMTDKPSDGPEDEVPESKARTGLRKTEKTSTLIADDVEHRIVTPQTDEPDAQEPSPTDEPDVRRQAGGESVEPSSKEAADFRVVLGHDGSGGEVAWAPSTKGSPHAFIVGIPGQGKSVTTRRIIRELADQGLPSLVFDFHGDMANDPPALSEVLNAAEGLPITPFDRVGATPREVNEAAWDLAEVVQFVTQLGDIQRSNVYKALQAVYGAAASSESVPTLSGFAEKLEEVEEGARGRNARERIIPLIDFGLFDEGSTRLFDPRERGMVIDLSGIRLEQVQIAGSSFLLRRVYKDMFTWQQDGTLKLAIVLDEAHRLSGDVTLPKLMKEGRKYGVAVIVASQGLADFGQDVLGNVGTKIVFRTNQPDSRGVAKYLRGRQGQDLASEIERLGVGQAYVSTADAPQAHKTQMLD